MIRTLIAEDAMLLRSGLVALLSDEPDINIVAELDCGDQIVPVASSLKPDVAVIDMDLPGMDGLTAAAKLHNAIPECRTLILTTSGTPGVVSRGLAAHALGFLDKNLSTQRLVRCVRQITMGRLVIDPHLAQTGTQAGENPLTGRELDALRLAAEGAPTTEIADRLLLTRGTVRNYISRAVSKVGARNRVDAIRIVTEAGWLLPAPPGAEAETNPGPAAGDRAGWPRPPQPRQPQPRQPQPRQPQLRQSQPRQPQQSPLQRQRPRQPHQSQPYQAQQPRQRKQPWPAVGPPSGAAENARP